MWRRKVGPGLYLLSEKQGLMVFRRVVEALLDDSGMLREPRKVGRQKNVVMVVVGCGQVRTLQLLLSRAWEKPVSQHHQLVPR